MNSEKKGELSEWALARTMEAYDKVASEDVGRLSIAQNILPKSTDFLRRIMAPASGAGGMTLLYVCPHKSCFPLEVMKFRPVVDNDTTEHPVRTITVAFSPLSPDQV